MSLSLRSGIKALSSSTRAGRSFNSRKTTNRSVATPSYSLIWREYATSSKKKVAKANAPSSKPSRTPLPQKVAKTSYSVEDTHFEDPETPPSGLAAALGGMSEEAFQEVTDKAVIQQAKVHQQGRVFSSGVQPLRLDIADAYKSYRSDKLAAERQAKKASKQQKQQQQPSTVSKTVQEKLVPEQQPKIVQQQDTQQQIEEPDAEPLDGKTEIEMIEAATLKINNNTASLFNTRIRKKINRGDYEEALKAWEKMRSKGIQPLLKSYLNIIDVLITDGPLVNVKYARRLLKEAAERGIDITSEQLKEYNDKIEKKVSEVKLADRKSKKHNYVARAAGAIPSALDPNQAAEVFKTN